MFTHLERDLRGQGGAGVEVDWRLDGDAAEAVLRLAAEAAAVRRPDVIIVGEVLALHHDGVVANVHLQGRLQLPG